MRDGRKGSMERGLGGRVAWNEGWRGCNYTGKSPLFRQHLAKLA